MQAIITRYRDIQRDETRYQIRWASDNKVIRDTACASEAMAFLVGLTSRGPIEVVSEDQITGDVCPCLALVNSLQ